MKKFFAFPVNILTLSSFLRIIESMKDTAWKNEKGKHVAKKWILRLVLTALCIATMAFIFSNSLQTGEESGAQSSFVTVAVQKIFRVFAPNSWIATATGEAYEKLHGVIRTLAHFSEFALLGALLVWCWRAYTKDPLFLLVPVCLVVLTPIVDECLQTLSAGRVAAISDVCTDTIGGVCGCVFAGLTLLIALAIKRRKKANTQ